MFLRAKIRRKDGKEHRTFSIVENRRVSGGRVVQRHVLYLGEINDLQELAWRKSIEAIEERAPRARTLSLFPDDRCEGLIDDGSIVRLKLKEMRLCRPRGAARERAHTAWRLIVIDVAEKDPTFRYRLDRDKLRQARRREGRYLLRTNLADDDPARLWSYYLQLVRIEEAFRNLKGDLAVRPIFHQLEGRVEAHIFIAFLAYCLHVTLARRLGAFAPGLTPRSVLEKFSAVQMIDVHIPTTDGREIQFTRHTEPQAELRLLLDKLKLELPPQPSPRITSLQAASATPL